MLKLNKKQQKFCDVYAKYGGNYTLVMQELKIGRQMFDKYMRQVEVKEYLDCAMDRVKKGMVDALPHIQATLLEMYNNQNTDDKIKLEIAKQFMDRAGLFADKNVNVNVNINTQLSMRARQILVEKAKQQNAKGFLKMTASLPCEKSVNPNGSISNLWLFTTKELRQDFLDMIQTGINDGKYHLETKKSKSSKPLKAVLTLQATLKACGIEKTYEECEILYKENKNKKA